MRQVRGKSHSGPLPATEDSLQCPVGTRNGHGNPAIQLPFGFSAPENG